MKEEKQNNHNSIFWLKGEGMNRRCHNIDVFKDLIRAGLSYQQIFRKARKYFRPKRIDEYYEIAFDEVNNSDEEYFMEKVKKGKLKPRKDVPNS